MVFNETFTITFGDVAENHVNMEKLGNASEEGFSINELNIFKDYFDKKGLTTVLYNLKDLVKDVKRVNKKDIKDKNDKNDKNEEVEDGDEEVKESPLKKSKSDKVSKVLNKGTKKSDGKKVESITKKKEKEKKKKEKYDEGIDEDIEFNEAYLLIIRNGLSGICDSNEFHKEQMKLDKDKKAFMYGRVVNKTARHNLCFIDGESREPDYENGKGRIVSFNDCPLLLKTKQTINDIIGDKANGLVAEGNYYYDVNKCGIGWHGDAERRKVIAVRTGHSMKMCFNWFLDSTSIGTKFEQYLNHGDIYVMSEYTVGFNWRKKKIPTLRHSAGCNKFTKL